MSGMGPAMEATLDGGAVAPATVAASTVATVSTANAASAASAPVSAPASATAPSAPGAGTAQSVTAAPAATAAAEPVAQKPANGVTFPLRPATTATTQAPAPAVGHASAADAGSIGGALFSLVLVVGLILGLGWLAKRMPGLQRGAATGQLRVVASVALGPRERAVVVDVAGTQLLLGVGAGGVRALHTLEHPLPATEAAASSPFAQVLAQHFGRKP